MSLEQHGDRRGFNGNWCRDARHGTCCPPESRAGRVHEFLHALLGGSGLPETLPQIPISRQVELGVRSWCQI